MQISSDAVLVGVPFIEEENLNVVFDNLCKAVDTDTPPLKSIFRLKQHPTSEQNSSYDGTIIIKFVEPHAKNNLLKCCFKRFKETNSALSLRDISIPSDSKIYLNESLTKFNFLLQRNALKMKNTKLISTAHTKNGQVFVRTLRGDSKLITCMEDLDKINININENGTS